MDFLPAFFPPTHGDLEAARSSELSASRASLAAQALETRLQVQSAAEKLSAELKLYVPEFPKEILEKVSDIDEALGSIRAFLKTAYGDDLQGFLRDCQEFAWYLDAILTRSGIELEEMAPARSRLFEYKSKQTNQARDRLDEALYAQEFQRETNASSKEVLRLHQVPSVAQLYASRNNTERRCNGQLDRYDIRRNGYLRSQGLQQRWMGAPGGVHKAWSMQGRRC